MKTVVALLLFGLASCAPKPKQVEAPVVVNIPAPESTNLVEEPLYVPQWTLARKNPEIVEVESISPLEAQYVLLETKELKVTARSSKGHLLLVCENGVSTLYECTNSGSITYMCNGIWLEISCKYKRLINGVMEEDPAPVEMKQNEEE